MDSERIIKLWNLATHETANDNEAANSFAALRRELKKTRGIREFFKTIDIQEHMIYLYQGDDFVLNIKRMHEDECAKLKRSAASSLRKLEAALGEATERAERAENAVRMAEEELSQLRSHECDSELGIIARRDAEIHDLAAMVINLKGELDREKLNRIQDFDSCMNVIIPNIFDYIEMEVESFSKNFKSKHRPAVNRDHESKKPQKVRKTNQSTVRKGEDVENFVINSLGPAWRTIREIFESAKESGYTGTENAIRFAADRVSNNGLAKKGRNYHGAICYCLPD